MKNENILQELYRATQFTPTEISMIKIIQSSNANCQCSFPNHTIL